MSLLGLIRSTLAEPNKKVMNKSFTKIAAERHERLEQIKSEFKSWSHELERTLKFKNEAFAELSPDCNMDQFQAMLNHFNKQIVRLQEKIAHNEIQIVSLLGAAHVESPLIPK